MTDTSYARAVLSDCGTYRYVLRRHIPCVLRWVKPCLFIMLNPSIADASIDDPTIRRCMGFAKAWAHTSLTVVNLFAFRATDPRELELAENPFGVDNLGHLTEQISMHSMGTVVAAWGAHPMAKKLADITASISELGAQCLGTTKDGSPKHPLYVKADTRPTPWVPR